MNAYRSAQAPRVQLCRRLAVDGARDHGLQVDVEPHSMRMRTTPSAARRKPNGSRLPLGFLPIEKTPASVSSLSAIARICPPRMSGSDRRRSAADTVRRSHRQPLGLAVGHRIVAPHRALQVGKLADHAGHEIAFRQRGGALDDGRVRAELAGKPGRQLAMRWLLSNSCRGRAGKRRRAASPDDSPDVSCDRCPRRTRRRPGAGE